MLRLVLLLGLAGLLQAGTMPSDEEMDQWMEAKLAEENNSGEPITQGPCNTPVPGTDRLQRGVDIVSLSVKPVDFTSDDGYKRPVFVYTCNGNRKWRNPYNNVQYDLPDQIGSIVPQPGEIINTFTKVWKRMKEVRDSFEKETELKFGNMSGIFGFSDSETYQYSHNQIQNSSRYVEVVHSKVSAFKVIFKPARQLTLAPMVLQFINQWLPPTFEANPTAYASFIRYFGTHYWQQADFGGMLELHMDTSKDLYRVMTEASVRRETEIAFKQFLSFIGASSTAVGRNDARFTQATQETRRVYGGQGGQLDRTFYNRWKATIPSNPWLYAGSIMPLSAFIPDANKRRAMDRAVQVHNDQAVLGELLRTMSWFYKTVLSPNVTGDWQKCQNGLPRSGCSLQPVRGGTCGCLVTGCIWSTHHHHRKNILTGQAAGLMSYIRSERRYGPDHAKVIRLTQQVNQMTRILATEQTERTVSAVRNRGQQCYRRCRSRCRCCQTSELWASTTMPPGWFEGGPVTVS